MECKFTIGQKVVCIDDNFCEDHYLDVVYPTKGETYTLRTVEFDKRFGQVFVHLEEIVNPIHVYAGGITEASWDVTAFRPLVARKTDISVFTAMLTDQKQAVPA